MGSAFVTGGSGYVGRNLIRALVARQQSVRALARSEKAAAAVKALGAEPVMGDIMDRRSYADGLRGCEVIYHSAAAVDLWGPPEHFWQVNVEGTQMLLDAARGSSIPRFVHVSTEAVYADGGPMRDIRDDDPLPVNPLPRYPQIWSSSANPQRSYAYINKEAPEFIRFMNPGDYRAARDACGACHLPVIEAATRSLMANAAMFWGAAAYNNGILPNKSTILGEAYTADGKPGTTKSKGEVTPNMKAHGIVQSIAPMPDWATTAR
jgi:NAD(P)-dependent dehydrogenase (short-subunit alcohol dehydrogenase family)